ncbi:neogenin isoform X2 [Photinus pyralis]|uniref:neogenin isoform X2 n=1 Tax=Photinus pyralis TaxID=7054 RepID=UPI00126731A9|nr:neogenin isoform X2 [Photinus pyralis]
MPLLVKTMSLLNYVCCCTYRITCMIVAASVLTSIQAQVLEFLVEPSDTVVESGKSAVLDCVVRTSLEYPHSVLTVQWLDQDLQPVPFIGDTYRSQLTNESLYISSVIEEQGLTGNYQCRVSLPNLEAIVSRVARLSLASLSGLLLEPRDLTVYVGQKAYFACLVQASPPARIRWLKDERPLQLDELRMTVLPSGALEIDEVRESDEGSYRCNASGLSSYRLSNKANLKIPADDGLSISAPSFIAFPRDQIVVEGQAVTLDCAAMGNPKPAVKWLKDGFSIDMADLDSRFSWIGSTTSLHIKNIQESDAGTYQCRAENREDSLDTHATLDVQVPPRFLKRPKSKEDLVNKDVEFECSVYGRPEPKVLWLRNGEIINYNDYYQLVNGNNLKILGLIVGDNGLFQCIASNSAGNIQASASLKVLLQEIKPKTKNAQKPNCRKKVCNTFTQPHGDEPIKSIDKSHSRTLFSNLKPEKTAKLGTVGFGTTTKQTSLIFDDKDTYDPHSIFSALSSSDPDDNASNNLGDVLSAYTESYFPSKPFAVGDINSRSEILPGSPQDVKASIVKARFVTLNWQPPSTTNGDIITYSVYYRQEGSERERVQNTSHSHLEDINIGGLQPGRVYFFRVAAHNNVGMGPSSKSLRVITQSEEHVPSTPLEFNAFATTSRSIHVSWKPPHNSNGELLGYNVYYMETSSSTEHHVETSRLETDLQGLSVFTEYYIWAVALNRNGPGAATDEKLVKTFSAAPTQPPYNVTLEPASSTSIIIRWEPPPPEGQNGVITGYKLRFRKVNKKGDTITTPGNLRIFPLNNLERGSTYQVKLWAINVNGTGPSTEWHEVETYENDLDETKVPEPPSPLKVRPSSDKIYVMWNPPQDQTIKIRNYFIGWGKGVPDNHTEVLDEKQRSYIITGVEPNSEYVISLYANNDVGAGEPVYAYVRTREELPPEPISPLTPPMGLKAHISSPNSVVLYWTDTTLGKTQDVRDNRYYIVKCTDVKVLKNRYLNVTRLYAEFTDLKANTVYEFTVKLIKGRRESPWSMIVQNTTWSTVPNMAPTDLQVLPVNDNPYEVELRWQPPKMQNSFITGYIIMYTTNVSSTDREWKPHGVKGDKHVCIINNLQPSTKYYFKIQARNRKENGPYSSVVSFDTGANSKNGFSGTTLLYLIVAGCIVAILTIATVVIVLCCRRGEVNTSPQSTKKAFQKGSQHIKPPDLWIHHDQMELKALEKSHSANDGASSSGAMTLPRSVGANEYDSHESHHSNSLDKRTYVPNYMGISPEDSNLKVSKSKPISLRVDPKPTREPIATATPINTSLSQTSSDSTPTSRPPYPRTQYSMTRAHVTLDPNSMPTSHTSENPYMSHSQGGYDVSSSSSAGYGSHPPPVAAHLPPSSAYAPGLSVLAESQGGKRIQAQGHPLKSFSVPAPPPISAPGTPQPKHIVSSQPPITVRPSSSPYKKPSLNMSIATPPSRISASNPPPHTREEVQPLQQSHSTEELNQEMANLEGLMLTLNAITANEFEC